MSQAVVQSAGVLLLRNWQEVSTLFIEYIRKSPSSTYLNVNSIFVRYEHQKDTGNLSHIHLILQINWKVLSEEEKVFVKDLIRASIVDIVIVEEYQSFIDEGIYRSMGDYNDMVKDTTKFLPHHYNPRYLMQIGPGPNDFRCRKLNNRIITKDNTKHMFQKIPNYYSLECVKWLIKIGVTTPSLCTRSDEDYAAPIKYNLSFFCLTIGVSSLKHFVAQQGFRVG